MRGILLFAWALAGCESDEDLDGDGVAVGADCNDADPGQTAPVWLYVDADGDGFGGDTQELGCPGNAWLFPDVTDCDDTDLAVHPDAIELGCDGRDNDCEPSTADGPAVSVGSTWASIQAAIDSAGYGEIVEVCASTVKEDLTIHRPIELIGAGAGATVIEGTGAGATVHIDAPGTRIGGMTIRGGIGRETDGRRVGGGVVVTAEVATLEGVEVTGNEAIDGGGIAVLAGAALVLVAGSSVHDNTAVDRGGGLYVEDAAGIEVRDSSVYANLAFEGGGIWLRGEATIEASDIADNHANFGGGLVLDSPADTSKVVGVGDAVLRGNSAVLGGGVYGTGDLIGVTVDANDAEDGGGLYATGPIGLFQSTLIDNRAVGIVKGSGGGVMLPPATSLVASDVAMLGNTAEGWGGALLADTASIVLFGAQLESNIADYGAGIALVGSCPTCMLEGNALEFRANVARAVGGDVVIRAPDGTFELSDVLLHAATAPYGAAISIMAGAVELQDAEVSGALAIAPDSAAIEIAEANAALLVVNAVFMGNDPADVRVLPSVGEVAPGPNFSCASVAGCTVGP